MLGKSFSRRHFHFFFFFFFFQKIGFDISFNANSHENLSKPLYLKIRKKYSNLCRLLNLPREIEKVFLTNADFLTQKKMLCHRYVVNTSEIALKIMIWGFDIQCNVTIYFYHTLG